MKIWLLKTSREDCYILIKVPGKEEYIEVNIQVLKELWRKRGNKKMNLKFFHIFPEIATVSIIFLEVIIEFLYIPSRLYIFKI